jgi:hypothetical protein
VLKGIVRGYVSALGLDEHDWTDRFITACNASGQSAEDSDGWTAFAANVGRARIQRHEAVEMRWRWAGAFLLLLAAATATFVAVRFYGVRSGWWTSVLPERVLTAAIHPVHHFFSRILAGF